jgi:hypothetical protein
MVFESYDSRSSFWKMLRLGIGRIEVDYKLREEIEEQDRIRLEETTGVA